MSTLITRPTVGPSRPGEAPQGRSPATGAGLAGAAAALIGLVVCMSVALTGWFLADAGAHGDTTDALRVGSAAWLTGHGSHLVLSGVALGLTPLAVTMMLTLVAFRAGRWAGRHSAPLEDDRGLAASVAAFSCAYVVVAVVTCVLVSRPGATPVLGRALLGALVISVLAGGAGLTTGSGRLAAWLARVPVWVVDLLTGAVTAVLWLVMAGAVLAAVSLLLSFNEAVTVLSGLHLSAGEALSYVVVMALFAPNAALLGSAYLLGPGFAFGTATTVSPTAVSLGVVPAIPLLAALPGEGPTPGWLLGLLVVPVLAAALGAGTTLRRRAPIAHDLAALRGAGAGFAAGLLATVFVALSGGALGTGRMADIGAPVAELLVFATGLMTMGGLLGALAQNWWRRRDGRLPEPGADRPDDAEATVEVLR